MALKYLKLRIIFIGFIFIMAFVVICARAVHVQVYSAKWLSQKATDQFERSFKIVGNRGTIYDRNHREMAVSIEVTSIAANPSHIKNTKATARALAKIFKIKAAKLERNLKSKKTFIWLKRQATPKEAEAVKKLEIPGIHFIAEYNRFYPNTGMAAQALGFTGLDGDGLEGIEFSYDRHLRGPDRDLTVFKDALGNSYSAEHTRTPLSSGNNVVLTIDQNIQFIAESALAETVKEFEANSGIVIVMAPKTGAVLAMAHYPPFNPNVYRGFNRTLWRNRAITDPFEPGSTMKIFSAAAAIESGNISPNTIFYCENGSYRIGRNVIHDVKEHGWLSLQQIVKYSSNIGAVKVSEKIGAKKLYMTFRKFGFGEKTGLDCPGETTGSLSHYSRWANIDTGAIAFGHGVSASAIQLITAVSAIANDGILMQPHIVQAVMDPNGKLLQRFKPRQVRRVVSRETARIVKNIMKTVITKGGTGVNAALEGYSAGGKTGTSRKIDESGKYSKKKHIASFTGFTPADNPEISVLIVIDEPKTKYHGGTVAAPAFKKIAQESLNYLNIAPDSNSNKFQVQLINEVSG